MGVSDGLSFGHDDQVDESPCRKDKAKAQRCDLPGLRGDVTFHQTCVCIFIFGACLK